MVHVLLLILKVLGITLLILLGLVLLTLLLLLIAPFYYTIDAEYYGDVKAVGRIQWLCFVLDLKAMYGNSKFLYYLKSFGFTISTNDENDKHYRQWLEPEETKTKEEQKVPVTLVEDDFEDLSMIPSENKEIVSEKPPEKAPEKPPGIFARIHNKWKEAMEWVTSIPMRIHYKISEILSRILDFLANLKENIRKAIKKRDEIVQKVTDIWNLLQKSSTKQTWKDIRRYLLQCWKHVRPRKFHGLLRFGMEDPSVTGQVLGVIAMLMPLYRNQLVIAPDFEQQIFEGEIYARGHVQMGFFLIWMLQMVLNRNLVKTIHGVMTILGGNK